MLSNWSTLITYGSCFVLSLASALFPWINGEAVLVSLAAIVRTPAGMAALVLIAAAGQMAGKCVLYWSSRRIIPLGSGRFGSSVKKWAGAFQKSPARTLLMVFISSAVGIPPFYVITVLAGMFRVRFGPFFAVGACGRVVRFGALALVPYLLMTR